TPGGPDDPDMPGGPGGTPGTPGTPGGPDGTPGTPDGPGGTPIIPVVRDDDGDGMPDITGAPTCAVACLPTGPEDESPDPNDPTNPDPDGDGNTVPVAVATVVDWLVTLAGPSRVLEGDPAAFTVTARGRDDVEIVLGWAVTHAASGGTTAADFTSPLNGALTFAAGGGRSATFSLATNADDEAGEDNEDFSVGLTVTSVGGDSAMNMLERVRLPGAVTTTLTEYDPDELNLVILPEVARAMAGRQFQAVADRIGKLQNGGGARAGASLGGHSTWEELAAGRAQAMVDDDLDMKEVLGNSEFVFPLGGGAALGDGGDGGGGHGGMTLWGDGNYGGIGGKGRGIDWDGKLLSVGMGLDGRLRDDLVGGAMLLWQDADLDYTDANRVKGDYRLELTGLHPYLGWSAFDGKVQVWASAGYASGALDITRAGDTLDSDVSMTSLGLGAGGPLLRRDGVEVLAKAEAFTARAEVDGGDATDGPAISKSNADVGRLRVTVESKFARQLEDGATLTPSLETGARYDGGDGRTGGGIELGGGVEYHDPARGLSMGMRLRGLVSHSASGNEDWGISGSFKLQPGADGQGLSVALSPAYGNTAARTQRMWNEGLLEADDSTSSTTADAGDGDADLQSRLEVKAGYGLKAFTDTGLLTPFSAMTFAEDDRRLRLGVEWSHGGLLNLELSGERATTDDTTARDTFKLKGEVKF
ncbi:MAG: hypothetical protein OXU98_06595, partial [Gammaproteobacteria bacterium]|nr:hypothetical protein [Gammaproteobacteria bacterium]